MTVPASDATTLQDPWSIDLEDMDVAQPELFAADAQWAWFERLRKEDPVHFCASNEFGPYWSVTRYEDIMQVDTSHEIFSSEPNITIRDQPDDFTLPMFIAMDEPRHSQQRGEVNPVVGSRNLPNFAELIRSRTQEVLDGLPLGETFNWVDEVSIELTTRMLATLFDFPYEDRARLTRWSDVATALPGAGIVDSEEERRAELMECLEYFTGLWNQRVNAEPGHDMVSMLAHGEATRDMGPLEYLGNLLLLIVGGNDTTRNSMTGSVLALNQFPGEYDKLRANHKLIPSMVSETIRWQTPLAHMRRVAKQDTELGGKQIKAGDKVVMWYLSGNRDDSVFENPDQFIIDRPNVRKHLSFGYGIHRCMGSHLAELQLRILWEEILARFEKVELMAEPERTLSVFVKGYTALPVRLHPRAAG
ncbi:MAG: cytochrome P450 [Halieaceae bacterium]